MAEVEITAPATPEVITPQSTGAVEFDSGPAVTHHPIDNTSTGAVEFPGVQPTFMHGFEPSSGPVLGPEIETKVVEAPPAPAVAKPKTTATKK